MLVIDEGEIAVYVEKRIIQHENDRRNDKQQNPDDIRNGIQVADEFMIQLDHLPYTVRCGDRSLLPIHRNA